MILSNLAPHNRKQKFTVYDVKSIFNNGNTKKLKFITHRKLESKRESERENGIVCVTKLALNFALPLKLQLNINLTFFLSRSSARAPSINNQQAQLKQFDYISL